MEVLLDSNIIIYSLQSHQENLREWLVKHSPIISAITQLAVLGYKSITQKEIDFAKRYFAICEIIPIDQIIIHNAIKFRQDKIMSIGDAIIAATSVVNKLTLATANTKDLSILKI